MDQFGFYFSKIDLNQTKINIILFHIINMLDI